MSLAGATELHRAIGKSGMNFEDFQRSMQTVVQASPRGHVAPMPPLSRRQRLANALEDIADAMYPGDWFLPIFLKALGAALLLISLASASH